jgi:dephospho-CoA kinase
MKIIGITGGIGTGKSTILNILQEDMGAFVLEADRIAHELMQPGHMMYQQIVDAFSTPELTDALVLENQTINREVLGTLVFSDAEKLKQLNTIVHPAVKQYILSAIEEKQADGCPLFVIEAALLIEDGYSAICDELWYIYASEEVRIERLMEGRGYTLEKCRRVIQNQSDEDFYRKYCAHVVDNSGRLEDAKKQVKELLKTL